MLTVARVKSVQTRLGIAGRVMCVYVTLVTRLRTVFWRGTKRDNNKFMFA